MIQTVERRILHIVDDIDNINPTQMAIEPKFGGTLTINSSIDDYYDGGFGAKTDTNIYRFSKFNDIHYTESIYMTNPLLSVIIGGHFTNRLGSDTYQGSISTNSVNIGSFAGLTDTGYKGYGVYIGYGSGASISNTQYDVLIGYEAGMNSDGQVASSSNIFLGYRSGYSSIGQHNINIGASAGYSSTGEYNVNIGHEASNLSTNRDNSVAIGYLSGKGTTGALSVYIGDRSGYGVLGENNTGIGAFSLDTGISSKSYINTTAIGYESGYNSTGNGSIFAGMRSGKNSTGSYNSFIGYSSGNALIGDYNICLGYGSGTNGGATTSATNNIVIGTNSGLGITGKHNILIGRNSTVSASMNGIPYGINNVLSICSTSAASTTPLIAGDFGTGRVNIQKTLNLTPTTQPTTSYEGDIIYNSSTDIIQYRNATTWVDLDGPSQLHLGTESGKTGWWLLGDNRLNKGDIGTSAIDLSYSNASSTTRGATGSYSYAEGFGSTASGNVSHAEGYNTIASGDLSHAEGNMTIARGANSHAEGYDTSAIGDNSHAEGYRTSTSGANSHAEGSYTITIGDISHAEGYFTSAIGFYSHAEGSYTSASGANSHAEGTYTIARGARTHSEGGHTIAWADDSHAEGHMTSAAGEASHTEGWYTRAEVLGSHAEGYYNTILASAPTGAHVEGQYAFSVSGTQQHVVGIGTGPNIADRKNGFEVHTTGLVRAPEVSIAEIDGDTTNKALITKEYLVGISTGSTGFTLPNETGIWSIRGQLNHADVGGFNFTNRDAGWTFKISELIGNATGVMTPSYRESTVLQGYNSDLMIDRYVNITLSHRLGSLYWGYDGTITSTSLPGPRVAEVRGVILLTTTTCDVTFSLCTNINLNLLRLL